MNGGIAHGARYGSCGLPKRKRMTMVRLLVSVRNADEARIACDAGAHVIDVKEPTRGSLGRPDPDVVERVCDRVGHRALTSAALGELREASMWQHVATIPERVTYAKLGLAGCTDMADWRDVWARAITCIRATAVAVAVAYADWRSARAPSPMDVLGHGARLGCGCLLVDTFDKTRGDLLDHLDEEDLAQLMGACRVRGVSTALAGSLSIRTIPRLLPLAPDFVAVRGGVCRAGREHCIEGPRVRELVDLIRDSSAGQFA